MNNVIEKGSLKFDAFLRMLSVRLTLASNWTFSEKENVYYLGSGYWRARPVLDVRGEPGGGLTSTFFGVVLINPDRTAEELAAITAAMRILM